jgi:hypothetical protein
VLDGSSAAANFIVLTVGLVLPAVLLFPVKRDDERTARPSVVPPVPSAN